MAAAVGKCLLLNDAISNDIMYHILSFHCPSALLSLEMTCKAFREEKSELYAFIENMWDLLCEKRWNIIDRQEKSRLRKVLAVKRMKSVYEVLSKRKRIPKGKFTEKHNFIFGRGEAENVLIWMLIGHRDDTQLLRRVIHGQVHYSIELRLCFQNVSNFAVVFDLTTFGSSFAFFKHHAIATSSTSACGPTHQHYGDGGEEHGEFHCGRMVHLLSLNGVGVTATSRGLKEENIVSLAPLEFCVVSCDVLCPTSVKNETDFLTMMKSISFTLTIQSANQKSGEREATVSAKSPSRQALPSTASVSTSSATVHCFEESVVWDHYMELPGRVVLLRDKPLSIAV